MPGGVVPPPKLAELTTEALWDEVNTKVMGYLRCAREVAPLMAANGWGRIVNVSGLAARQSGSIIGSVRNVSVAALTKNLADELGPLGINVTVVHPGATRTERTSERDGRERHVEHHRPHRRGRRGRRRGCVPRVTAERSDHGRRHRVRRRHARRDPLLSAQGNGCRGAGWRNSSTAFCQQIRRCASTGELCEVLFEHVLRVGPRGIGVRVVGFHEDVLDADHVGRPEPRRLVERAEPEVAAQQVGVG